MVKKRVILAVCCLIVALIIGCWAYIYKQVKPYKEAHLSGLISMTLTPQYIECEKTDTDCLEKDPFEVDQSLTRHQKILLYYTLYVRCSKKDIKQLKETFGITALFNVRSTNPARYKVAQLLLDKGLDINYDSRIRNSGPNKALHIAIWNKNIGDVEWLLSKGADSSEAIEIAVERTRIDKKDRTAIIELLTKYNEDS